MVTEPRPVAFPVWIKPEHQAFLSGGGRGPDTRAGLIRLRPIDRIPE